MKSLLKIIRRYSVTAGVIVCVILASNLAAFMYWSYTNFDTSRKPNYRTSVLEQVGKDLREKNGSWSLPEQGQTELEKSNFCWGMGLDGNGKVVWEWKLPEDFARSYSLMEVAKLSRWYLNDYPVVVWEAEPLLLVFGMDPAVYMRYSETVTIKQITTIPSYLKFMLTVNFLVILGMAFLLGFRFYRALKPVGEGIERLSLQQPVKLREKGMTGDLARQLNRASRILQEQKEKLAKRDQARTEWISGVSHDIRTPLALIVGYSDRLKKSPCLDRDEQRLAEAVCRQSMVIRQLIADLNLTSKLSYQAQPLNQTICSPASLLRECAADIYNEAYDGESAGQVDIELQISPDMEQARMEADAGLVKRALRNLIGNSVRHGGEGCQVLAGLTEEEGMICFSVRDTGPGIPELVVGQMDGGDSGEESVHIMGLRLTRQIACAHQGELVFVRRSTGTYDAELRFPAFPAEVR